jgi:hypothetical protein
MKIIKLIEALTRTGIAELSQLLGSAHPPRQIRPAEPNETISSLKCD